MEYSFGKPIGIQSLPRVTTIWITHNPDLFVNFNTLLHRLGSVMKIAENFWGWRRRHLSHFTRPQFQCTKGEAHKKKYERKAGTDSTKVCTTSIGYSWFHKMELLSTSPQNIISNSNYISKAV